MNPAQTVYYPLRPVEILLPLLERPVGGRSRRHVADVASIRRLGSLSLLLGILSSWAASWLWNQASTRLPGTLAGQLIAFETLAALAYAAVWRGIVPAPHVLAGAALLLAGVVVAIRCFTAEMSSNSHAEGALSARSNGNV